ncbi:hypothetical protein BHM03_00029477 [Ensete ventricosum]|nr:hypothetical protein BHM03_00029477 [Ensete ventricosum]
MVGPSPDQTTIKGHPKGNYGGDCLVPIPKREKSSDVERGTSDYTPKGNTNLVIEGISLGTHYLGEDLSLQEQLHGSGRRPASREREEAGGCSPCPRARRSWKLVNSIPETRATGEQIINSVGWVYAGVGTERLAHSRSDTWSDKGELTERQWSLRRFARVK